MPNNCLTISKYLSASFKSHLFSLSSSWAPVTAPASEPEASDPAAEPEASALGV